MVYGIRHSSYLFDKHSADVVVDHQRQLAMKELEGFTEAQILISCTEYLVRYLLEKYKLEVPLLHEDKQHVHDQEIQQQIENRGYDIFSDRAGGTLHRHHQPSHSPHPIYGRTPKCSPFNRAAPPFPARWLASRGRSF